MLSRSKPVVYGLLRWGVCLGLVFAAGVRVEAAQPTTGHDALTAAAPTEEGFDNPEAIAKYFDTQLTRLAGAAGHPSPSELAEQAAAHRTYVADALPDEGRKLDAEAIYARARAGVVIFGAIPKGKRKHGAHPAFATGFVIHKDGLIVSNAHVLEAFRDMKAVGVMTSDGRVFPIKAVLAADKLNDVAVLRIDAHGLAALPVAKSVPVGATIYCLSHPLLNDLGTETGFFAFTQGIVSGRYRSSLMGRTPINVLTVTADYARGSSGGPILNQHGAVVGMVCQTLTISDDNDETQMTWKLARPSSSILAMLRGSP
jgi:S1-C subfamily serine protease